MSMLIPVELNENIYSPPLGKAVTIQATGTVVIAPESIRLTSVTRMTFTCEMWVEAFNLKGEEVHKALNHDAALSEEILSRMIKIALEKRFNETKKQEKTNERKRKN